MPGDSDPLGGGIYAEGSDISILANIVRGNTAGRGGGIAIVGGEVHIRGNTIVDNTGVSDHGGGLYIAAPGADISGNRIVGNAIGRELGYGWGGGIVVYGEGSSAVLSHNDVTGNYAPSVGSGVFIDDGAIAILDHELIHDNVCPDGGTTGGVGIYVDGYGTTVGSQVTIVDTTVAGHDCQTQGGNGLYVEEQSAVTIRDSIFWDNGGDDFIADATSRISATYTLSRESLPGSGNISTDPLFADPRPRTITCDPRPDAGTRPGTAARATGCWTRIPVPRSTPRIQPRPTSWSRTPTAVAPTSARTPTPLRPASPAGDGRLRVAPAVGAEATVVTPAAPADVRRRGEVAGTDPRHERHHIGREGVQLLVRAGGAQTQVRLREVERQQRRWRDRLTGGRVAHAA